MSKDKIVQMIVIKDTGFRKIEAWSSKESNIITRHTYEKRIFPPTQWTLLAAVPFQKTEIKDLYSALKTIEGE